VVAAVVCCALAGAPAPAAAAARQAAADPCRTVHVGPVVATDATSTGYFDLTLEPGERTRAALLVANPAPRTCRVLLLPAYGRTAVNSGNTYPPVLAGQPCVGSSCGLAGLPRTVSVPTGTRQEVPFEVAVPAGTAPGQYLAGVVAQPADVTGPSAAPTAGQGEVSAQVVAVVALGVAVTVPGALRPAMEVAEVRVTAAGAQGMPTMLVTERNSGNTWERAKVQVEVTAGGTPHRFAADSATVLPGNSAVLSLPVSGVPAGSHRTRVTLTYGNGARAVFDQVVAFPAQLRASVDESGNVTLTTGVPRWVYWVLGGLAASVLVLLAGLLVLLRSGSMPAARRARRASERTEAGDRPLPAAGRHGR
jgi:hypothetical protein